MININNEAEFFVIKVINRMADESFSPDERETFDEFIEVLKSRRKAFVESKQYDNHLADHRRDDFVAG